MLVFFSEMFAKKKGTYNLRQVNRRNRQNSIHSHYHDLTLYDKWTPTKHLIKEVSVNSCGNSVM